jgi:syntaxin 16
MTYINSSCSELQGHAIKNQDLLIASGTISLKGSEGMSAVDEDVEAAVGFEFSFSTFMRSHLSNFSKSRSQALAQDLLDPDLRRRDRELTDIAKSIGSLAELFKDLSVLVIDQGTLLDSVEYNIEQTAAHVQEAVRELNVAMRWVICCHSCLDLIPTADINKTLDVGNAFSFSFSSSLVWF